MTITIKETKDVKQDDIIEIYKANKWSSAEKPDQLFKALLNSHTQNKVAQLLTAPLQYAGVRASCKRIFSAV
jgi:hypothetical protein